MLNLWLNIFKVDIDGSMIFKEFSSNSLRLGASNRCALTPPIPKLFTPAIPEFQVFQLKKTKLIEIDFYYSWKEWLRF